MVKRKPIKRDKINILIGAKRMFYEKNEYKVLKKKSSNDCLLCFGKSSGHEGISEKDPVCIIIADNGIFLERAKGDDAFIPMEQVEAYRHTDSEIILKTKDASAKRLHLIIKNQKHREKGCKVLDKYMSKKE